MTDGYDTLDDQETEDQEEVEQEVDESALKYEAGKKALREERKRVRQLEAELKALKSGKDEEDYKAQARAEIAREFGAELARERAVNLLKDKGYKGNPERGAKLLDLASVLDDNGKVNRESLSDLVDEWIEDEPQLFKRPRKLDEEDDEEEATPRRKPSLDLGKRPAAKTSKNEMEDALSKMVGNPQLH